MSRGAISPLKCPICGATNPLRARICVGCGLDLAEWEDKHDRFRAQEADFLEAHAQDVQEEMRAAMTIVIRRNWRRVARLIVLALIMIIVAGAIVTVGTVLVV